MNVDQIPAALKALPCWVNHKPDKRPVTPLGDSASSTNPASWSDFDTVVAAHKENESLGIGFVLTKENGITGIDLDKCRDPKTGNLKSWAAAIVEQINTYAEVSPSGTGLHLLTYGQIPAEYLNGSGGMRKANVEIYMDECYLTVTGNRLPGPTEPEQRQEALTKFCAKHFKPTDKSTGSPRPVTPTEPTEEQWVEFKKHPKADATLKRTRDDLADQSASSYDMALANLAVKAGFSDGNILWMLHKWRTKHKEDTSKLYKHKKYLRTTIAKARATGNKAPTAPVNLQAIERTEDGLALAFAEKYKSILQYDHTCGKWLRWDKTRWKIEDTYLAFSWARDLCREYKRPEMDKTLPKMRTAANVEIFAQRDRRFAVTFEKWDRDPWLLCTPAGAVDLKTGNLRENRQTDYMTKQTTVEPAVMDTPEWNKFLREATCGDAGLVRFLQIIAGYSLTGVTIEQALFFLYGSGGNGKGVFVNAVTDVMGDYHVAANMDVFTAKKYDAHPTELARLHGARMVTASETEQGKEWNETRIKSLTGGDKIAARYMHKDFFEYVPEFKLVFQGNHKPILKNVDHAAKRRFNILPFIHLPKKVDPDLPDKLKAEYPGILRWAIDGCTEWQKTGLVVPDAVKRETDAYFEDQDTFQQWLDECTERTANTNGETRDRLYKNWAAWAIGNGDSAGNKQTFKENMSRTNYEESRRTGSTGTSRGYKCISLKTA